MGAIRGVEVPLDTLLEYSFLNLVVIPCIDGFPELSLSAGEIGAIFGSDLLYLAPSYYKPPSEKAPSEKNQFPYCAPLRCVLRA